MNIQTLPEIVIVDQEDLVVISKREYLDILSRLEWYEGEQQRLEDRIDEYDSQQFEYEQRNNSLEG